MPNRLQFELSPYLLQHAQNPVDWRPWGDDAFREAQEKNKPILVSIGYAACHWCHVMEQESFEDKTVAAYMNEHFINIKVDREELPAVDHFYMDALQAMNGQGGWPLNVFVTPDKKPFYGGTYFPPQPMYNRLSWMDVLQRIQHAWTLRGDEIHAQANQLTDYLNNASKASQMEDLTPYTKGDLEMAVNTLLQFADKESGGFGSAPKFPGTMSIQFLLASYQRTKNEEALQHAIKSVNALLRGGIYDCLGSGLCRYTVDKEWLIPHFEKMLYDNALLLSVLCDTFQVTGNVVYKQVIDDLICFLNKELKGEEQLYYCAIDADADGEEGAFYYWSFEELKSILNPEELTFAMEHLEVSEQGNWEGKNILHVDDIRLLADDQKVFKAIQQKLIEERNKRNRPLTDDKALLSWNALLNWSLTKAGKVLQNEHYIALAVANMDALFELFDISGTPGHVYKNGSLKHAVNLDDFAFLTRALIELTNATGNPKWMQLAKEILQKIETSFYDQDQKNYFFTSHQNKDILVRKIDEYDGSIPSSNSILAEVLIILGSAFKNPIWMAKGERLLAQIKSKAKRNPYAYAYWNLAAWSAIEGCPIITCTKSQFDKIKKLNLSQVHFDITEKKNDNIDDATEWNSWEEELIICIKDRCTKTSIRELILNFGIKPLE
jgi:uncharacterized protein